MIVASRIERRWATSGRWIPRTAGLGIAVLALAACGGRGGDGYGGAGAPSDGSSGSSAGTVAVKDVPDVGPALVDGAGKTLYFSDQEAAGAIKCVAGCLGFWFPVPGDANAASTAAVPGLAVIHRPDNGMAQLTYHGKPLYTFKLDAGPAQHNGHNLDDSFGNVKFTWHAASTSASASATPSASKAPSGYDYGSGY
jgi:predicted lipoprotein with Yx(FWY)xxD motif